MRALLATSLFLALAACSTAGDTTEDPTISGGGKGDNPTSDAAAWKQLTDVVKANGAFRMPPIGVKHHANELTPVVDIVSAQGDVGLRVLVDAEITRIGGVFDSGAPQAGLVTFIGNGDNDIHAAFRAGYGDADVRKYLIDSLLRTDLRDKARRALSQLTPYYVWYQTYDIGAEIIGEEVILIKRLDSKDVIRIRLSYVQS